MRIKKAGELLNWLCDRYEVPHITMRKATEDEIDEDQGKSVAWFYEIKRYDEDKVMSFHADEVVIFKTEIAIGTVLHEFYHYLYHDSNHASNINDEVGANAYETIMVEKYSKGELDWK